MLELLRRHMRPATAALLAVLLLAWVTGVAAHHPLSRSAGKATAAPPGPMASAMMHAGMASSGDPCPMEQVALERNDCADTSNLCCVALPDFTHASRHAGFQLPDWGKVAVLFSATPTLLGQQPLRAERAWPPPSPGSVPPRPRPFDSFRILLI